MRHEIAFVLLALMALGLALLVYRRIQRKKRHRTRDRSLKVDLLRRED
ncbi:MAG TPA: hypothetical protein VGC35_11245 [Allosphingosinicella sp.]|jgi:positive regulator of sigma E activity